MVVPPHSLQLQSQRVRETDEERKSFGGRHWSVCFTRVLTVLQAYPYCCAARLGGVCGEEVGGGLLVEKNCYCTDKSPVHPPP